MGKHEREHERVPDKQRLGYTAGEIRSMIAPLVGLDDPGKLDSAVIFAYSDNELRVAMGVPDEAEYRAVIHRLMHELVDMMQ